MPPVLGDASVEHILTLIIVFICSSHYIKNPYLTAKLVEVWKDQFVFSSWNYWQVRIVILAWWINQKIIHLLSFGQVLFVINPAVQRNTEKLNDMVLSHRLAMEYLVPALMNFYTGAV